MRIGRDKNVYRRLAILVPLMFLLSSQLVSAIDNTTGSTDKKPHDLFLGLAWSADLSAPSWGEITHPSLDSITSVVTLGDRRIFPYLPIRGRISIGWFPGHPFRLGAGVEIALLELLNGYDARGFGIYAFLDEILLFQSQPTLEPRAMLGILLPLTPTGGICVAAGVTKGWQPRVTLTLMNGGYPH